MASGFDCYRLVGLVISVLQGFRGSYSADLGLRDLGFRLRVLQMQGLVGFGASCSCKVVLKLQMIYFRETGPVSHR